MRYGNDYYRVTFEDEWLECTDNLALECTIQVVEVVNDQWLSRVAKSCNSGASR